MNEGASRDSGKRSLDRMEAENYVRGVKKENYKRRCRDSDVDELIALCIDLSLPNSGVKDELVQ